MTIEGTPITPATTNADGFYSFERMPEGTYTATASASGCTGTQTRELVVSGRRRSTSRCRRAPTPSDTRALEQAPFEEAETVLPITGTSGTVALPFAFTFYGFTYTRAHANGFVEFVGPATTNCSATNAAIPTTGRPNGQIAAFWDDRSSTPRRRSADVRGRAPNRRFVIEFRNAHFSSDTTRRVDFNVVLTRTGRS